MFHTKFGLLNWLWHLINYTSGKLITMAIVVHMAISYVLFYYFNEVSIVGEAFSIETVLSYIYFCFVTYSTLGYGEMTPSSLGGQMTIAFWMIPFGMTLFATLIGKGAQVLGKMREKRLRGEIKVTKDDHIVILGWNKNTMKIIDLILADQNRIPRHIVLGVIDEIENPVIDYKGVSFVKLKSYTEDECLEKVCIKTAKKVIINGHDDNENFLIGIHLTGLNNGIHISTYFEDESKARALQRVNPNIECSVERVAEMLTRTMQDHGSSVSVTKLMDMQDDATILVYQFTPKNGEGVTMKELRDQFWTNHRATIIGIAYDQNANDLEMVPEDNKVIESPCNIHYVAKERISA